MPTIRELAEEFKTDPCESVLITIPGSMLKAIKKQAKRDECFRSHTSKNPNVSGWIQICAYLALDPDLRDTVNFHVNLKK